MSVIFRKGSTFFKDTFIRDYDILQFVGSRNYGMLQRIFPGYFEYYKDCDERFNTSFNLPSYINLYIINDPEKTKLDIIKTIYYRKYVSPVSNLVISYEPLNIKINCDDTNIYIWIFICLISIILFLISIYVLYTSKSANKIFYNFVSENSLPILNEKKIKKN